MEFTTVVGKNRKRHNKYVNSPLASSGANQPIESAQFLLIKKLDQADFEFRNECSPVFDLIKLSLNSCCKQIESNLFFLAESSLSSSTSSTPPIQIEWSIVSYGVGRFSDSWIALYQLALLRLIAEHLHVPPSRISLTDPQFSPSELTFLSDQLSFRASNGNDDCRHAISAEPPYTACTLFFMPHCGKPMYNNVLLANWSPARLSRVALFGNSLTNMRERAPSSAFFARNLLYIERALTASGFATEAELSVAAVRRSGVQCAALDAIEPVLNDTALTYFDPKRVATDCCDFWAIVEPEYDQSSLEEFIPMRSTTSPKRTTSDYSSSVAMAVLCEEHKCAPTERVPLPPLLCKYYVVRWLADAGGEQHSDLCVLVHSNRCLVLTLSQFHPALFDYSAASSSSASVSASEPTCSTSARRRGMRVRRVDFGAARVANPVVGRSKRGAQQLEPRTQLCTLYVSHDDERPATPASDASASADANVNTSTETETSESATRKTERASSSTSYSIRCGVRGRLLEVNPRLVSEPQLVAERTSSEGYLAIVLAPLSTHAEKLVEEMLDERQYLEILRKRGLDINALPPNPFL